MPPLNDNDYQAVFEDDFLIPCSAGASSVTDSNVGATKQVGEPDFDGTPGGHSVWWWWIGNGNGTVTVTVTPDPSNGNPLSAPLILVYDADFDDFNSPLAEGAGSVTFTSIQEEDYAIGVDGAAGDTGDFILTVSVAGPANDLLANAEVLAGDSGSTTGANNFACVEDSDPGFGFFNVWYAWTPSVTGWARLRETLTDAAAEGSTIDVWTGGPGAWVPAGTRSFTGGAGSAWDATFPVEAGETYYISVSGAGTTPLRFALAWLAVLDLSDVEPGDLVVGPAVSTNTYALNQPTSAGTWFRFEFEHVSGPLPVTDFGLVELRDASNAIVGQVRLAGDRLQYRATGSGAWTDLGYHATLGSGLAKVRLELYYPLATVGSARLRVNGVPASGALRAGADVRTLKVGCLWNTAADNVEVGISAIGARVDPDLGPWGSTDPDDKGITFLWGGEAGEIGRSQSTDWLTPLSGTDPAGETIIAAPGVGASPFSRYGYALNCAGGAGTIRGCSIGGLGFSPRAAVSFYLFVSDYPSLESRFATIWNGGTLDVVHLSLTPTGVVKVSVGGEYVVAVRHISLNRWHHFEVYLDSLLPGRPTTVRLNGVNKGPYYRRSAFGLLLQTTPFVPTEFKLGKVTSAGAYDPGGLAVKDMTVYHQREFPLGGQMIRKRSPNGSGSHDANVDEWVSGSNQQTPITDGDGRFDFSLYAVDDEPPDWLHNSHFGDTSSDDPMKKMQVEIASGGPPAAMVGEKVLRYYPNAPPPQSGAYVLLPPPAVTNGLAYLVEAWIKKDVGTNGKFDSWAGLIAGQQWPWSDVVADAYGGWFRHSKERSEIVTPDQFGFNHNATANNGHQFEIGPITIWENYVYEPRATGFWESADDGATYTSIQDGEGTSYLRIDEWPGAAGADLVGVGPATRGWDTPALPAGNAEHFVEYLLDDAHEFGAPYAARLYVRGRSYLWANRSTDPATGGIVYPSRAAHSSSDAALYAQALSGADRRWLPALALRSGTFGHDSYMLPVGPDDQAWTLADWNAWRIRLGYPTGPVSPSATSVQPAIEAFAVELLGEEAELPPEPEGPIINVSMRVERSTATPADPEDPGPTVHLSGVKLRAERSDATAAAPAGDVNLSGVEFRAERPD